MKPSTLLRRAIDDAYRDGRKASRIVVDDNFLDDLKDEYRHAVEMRNHTFEFDGIPLEVGEVAGYKVEVAN